MKCKRCGTEMQRRREKDHRYIYVCPKCGLKVGGKQEETNEYQQAYETVMGRN